VAAKLGLKAVLVQENWVDWPESTVLYAHLGGQPALNAYSALFRS